MFERDEGIFATVSKPKKLCWREYPSSLLSNVAEYSLGMQCQDIRTWLNLVTRVGIDTNLSMNSTTYRIVKLREFYTRFQLLQHGFIRLANRGVVGFDLIGCVHKDGSADLGTCVRACLSVGVSVTF